MWNQPLWEQPIWSQPLWNDCSIDQGLSEDLHNYSPHVKVLLVPQDALENANIENEEEPELELTMEKSYSIQDEGFQADCGIYGSIRLRRVPWEP